MIEQLADFVPAVAFVGLLGGVWWRHTQAKKEVEAQTIWRVQIEARLDDIRGDFEELKSRLGG